MKPGLYNTTRPRTMNADGEWLTTRELRLQLLCITESTLNTDDGARFLGKWGIGTNYGIQRFTKNMLFDEKIGGTIHCAVGAGSPETKSKINQAFTGICSATWASLRSLWMATCSIRTGKLSFSRIRHPLNKKRTLITTASSLSSPAIPAIPSSLSWANLFHPSRAFRSTRVASYRAPPPGLTV